MADLKSAPLADDLKEFARSVDLGQFPKNMFCGLCSELLIFFDAEAFKLQCCAKTICPSCYEKLNFPTTCPSCDHTPLESEACVVYKSLRGTMRNWLQKRKKKDEAAAAAQVVTPVAVTTPAATESQAGTEVVQVPRNNDEDASQAVDAVDAPDSNRASVAGDNGGAQENEEEVAIGDADVEPQDSAASPSGPNNDDPSAAESTSDGEVHANADMTGGNGMMNDVSGQMPFFPNQPGFNNAMGFGMMPMDGMANMMMPNGNFNNPAFGMYGSYGGNMGMPDMSAMNMMSFNGYGGGFNGMGGGFGGFNGSSYNNGYNSGSYYPNQSRINPTQGGAFAQKNRTGSRDSFGRGFQHANSPPGNRSGPGGQATDDHANHTSAAEGEGENELVEGATDASDGKKDVEEVSKDQDSTMSNHVDKGTGDNTTMAPQDSGLNAIQTFDSENSGDQVYDQSMMGGNMMPYSDQMMNPYLDQQANGSFNSGMGYNHSNNFAPRGNYNNTAYGAARVLVGSAAEPSGVGVAGAPTGPRAMREGRPNTGFSSRVNSARFNAASTKNATSVQEAAPSSPQRRLRSKSPQRDESLRVRQRSASRSRSPERSRSVARNKDRDEQEGRSRSVQRSRRSRTPQDDREQDRETQQGHRNHRTSYREERDDEYDDRNRDDRGGRGDRTRSASVESHHRSSRRDKDKYRSSRSHRDRSREHRHRHRSRSPREDKYQDDTYASGDRDTKGSSRHRNRTSDDEKYRDRDRDRKDRKDRDRDYDYSREKDRSRKKEDERRRRRDREAEDDERDYDDDKYRSSRRSRKDRERERDTDRSDRPTRPEKEHEDEEEDRVGKLMLQMRKKRTVSPPLNAPTGPAANGFSIKGRSKVGMPPPTGPKAAFQPPKGPAVDRHKDRDSSHHRRNSSVSSKPDGLTQDAVKDHYAAERERNARERDERSRDEVSSRSLESRISKRSHHEIDEYADNTTTRIPTGPKADSNRSRPAVTGPASKRRKSGAPDVDIVGQITARIRNGPRRGGVKKEGDAEREAEVRERDRDRR